MVKKWCYLYRTIDTDGYILDNTLRKTRDYHVTYAFTKRLVKASTVPTTIKATALLCTFKKFRNEGMYKETMHCIVEYRNNLIGQEHGFIKMHFVKSTRFQNLSHAPRAKKKSKWFILYINETEIQVQILIFRRTIKSRNLVTIV